MKAKLVGAALGAIAALKLASTIDKENPVALVADKAVELIELALRFLLSA